MDDDEPLEELKEVHMVLAGQDVVLDWKWLLGLHVIAQVFPGSKAEWVRINGGQWMRLSWQDNEGARRAREILEDLEGGGRRKAG